MRRTVLGALAVVALTVAGCSGVPSSSRPERVRPVPAAARQAVAAVTPVPGESPAEIVRDFLQANVSQQDDHHANAKLFLTPEAATTWSEKTLTIVDSVSSLKAAGTAVTLQRAHKLGTLDTASGVYTPDTSGDGLSSGLDPFPATFDLVRYAGEWRISKPPTTLIVSKDAFDSAYRILSLYFFDQAEQRLIPDIRYSPFVDPQVLARWKLSQVIAGPRPELQDAVRQVLAQQTTSPGSSSKASVTFGAPDAPAVIELPGSARLDDQSRDRLAAQLSAVFRDTSTELELTDGGKPVQVPGKGIVFSAADFGDLLGDFQTSSLYYLNNNSALADERGRVVAGKMSNGGYRLISLAVSDPGSDNLLVAGVNADGQLQSGTVLAGLSPVAGVPPGPLSRPVWAPGTSEVWIAAGRQLLQVPDGTTPKPQARRIALSADNPSAGGAFGTIVAVKFSSEGSRVALVVNSGGPSGPTQVWVGAVVRTGSQPSVESLVPVTPTSLKVRDVAWQDDTTLFFAGSNPAESDNYWLWTVQADGSKLSRYKTDGLTQLPDTVAAAKNKPLWVSSGGRVYSAQPTWAGIDGRLTVGTSPTYTQ